MFLIPELFLTCALSLPAANSTRPPILSWFAAKSEEDRLRDFIHKNAPDAEIFIHQNPDERRLKENHWERIPFTFNGKKIWIKRKPISDKKLLESA